ncbi:MAG: response regulator [Fibromonadaceae bacterium]|jgi:CheY-like chemotaxis protein|nr:response regulator [Fibromonadaceae bacterium]
MSRKERLLAISDLNIARKMRQMNDEQLNEYIEDLTLFTKNFPTVEKKLKDSLNAEDYDLFAKYLAVAGNMLSRIHADDMAAECREQLDWLKNAKKEKIEVFVNYFLKSTSMLIVNIQKALEEVIDKEKLLAILDLNSEKISKMNDELTDEFIQAFNFFIEHFPEKEAALKASMRERNYKHFEEHLIAIEKMMKNIYADDIAAECQKQINEIKNARYEKIEAFVAYLLKRVSILSIDLQMIKYKKQENEVITPSNGTEVKSILAVDDTEFFLRNLKILLQDTPHKLTYTTSGKIALNFLQKNHPDLFILDIEMPEMNGYELAIRIRECGQQAPIIFLTGSSSKESVVKALRAGASDFIVKPISKEQILQRINKFI